MCFLQFTTASVSKAVSDLKNHISMKQAPVVEGDDGDLDGILNRLSLSGTQTGLCVKNDYICYTGLCRHRHQLQSKLKIFVLRMKKCSVVGISMAKIPIS